jgi:hypothetical protein
LLAAGGVTPSQKETHTMPKTGVTGFTVKPVFFAFSPCIAKENLL